MKLSDFCKNKISKKVKFVNGKVVVEDCNKNLGDVDIYNLNGDLLLEMKETVSEEEDMNKLVYKVMPIISNIEVDLSFKEFMEEIVKNPSTEFLGFMEVLISIMDEGITQIKSLEEASKSAQDKVENVKESLRKELEDLRLQLKDNVDNPEALETIIKRINEIEKYLGDE